MVSVTASSHRRTSSLHGGQCYGPGVACRHRVPSVGAGAHDLCILPCCSPAALVLCTPHSSPWSPFAISSLRTSLSSGLLQLAHTKDEVCYIRALCHPATGHRKACSCGWLSATAPCICDERFDATASQAARRAFRSSQCMRAMHPLAQPSAYSLHPRGPSRCTPAT
jgi:hypothetical protein